MPSDPSPIALARHSIAKGCALLQRRSMTADDVAGRHAPTIENRIQNRTKEKRLGGAFVMKVVPRPRNSLKREADVEARSGIAGFYGRRPAVFLNDLFGDKKSETGTPVSFCGKEWLENFR